MKKSKSSRKVSTRTGFNNKLSAYSGMSAAALTATGVAGFTSIADGQIINLMNLGSSGAVLSTTSISITGIGVVNVGAASTADNAIFKLWSANSASAGFIAAPQMNFKVKQTNSISSGNRYAYGFAAIQGVGNGFKLAATGSVLKKLGAGDNLNVQNFASGQKGLFYTQNTATGATGNFPAGNLQSGSFALNQTAYMGFRQEKSAGHYYFGWLRVKVTGDADGRPIGIVFVADGNGIYGAFNKTLDGGILAGQFAAVPEPANVAGGLALFALGAVGVREYRRRRKQAA